MTRHTVDEAIGGFDHSAKKPSDEALYDAIFGDGTYKTMDANAAKDRALANEAASFDPFDPARFAAAEVVSATLNAAAKPTHSDRAAILLGLLVREASSCDVANVIVTTALEATLRIVNEQTAKGDENLFRQLQTASIQRLVGGDAHVVSI